MIDQEVIDRLGPNPTMVAKWRPILKSLKIEEYVIIPWHEFVGRKPASQEPKPMSDGRLTWLSTPSDQGMIVKRIE